MHCNVEPGALATGFGSVKRIWLSNLFVLQPRTRPRAAGSTLLMVVSTFLHSLYFVLRAIEGKHNCCSPNTVDFRSSTRSIHRS